MWHNKDEIIKNYPNIEQNNFKMSQKGLKGKQNVQIYLLMM